MAAFDWLRASVHLRVLQDASQPDQGIVSAFREDEALQGVTDQFLANAEEYHRRYSSLDYFRWLIEIALTRRMIDRSARLRVLDLGSGSGNSVIPLLRLLPNAEIVATDISRSLLRILRDLGPAHVEGFAVRTRLVQMDATRRVFADDTFDLAVGAAILHHLTDVEAAIVAAGRALRPGGTALFFEPFEAGHAILRLALDEITNDRRAPLLPPDVARLLRGLSGEYRMRAGRDKSRPEYSRIDDKWLFTKTFVSECAAKAGFAQVTITPIHPLDAAFTTQMRALLNLGLGKPPDVLPHWAWRILGRFDRAFSTDLLNDLPLEACIELRRP